jgi:hypothetical protein
MRSPAANAFVNASACAIPPASSLHAEGQLTTESLARAQRLHDGPHGRRAAKCLFVTSVSGVNRDSIPSASTTPFTINPRLGTFGPSGRT